MSLNEQVSFYGNGGFKEKETKINSIVHTIENIDKRYPDEINFLNERIQTKPERRDKWKENINFNNVIQSLNIGVVVIDLNGIVKSMNLEAEKILNIKSDEAISMELSKIFSRKLFLNSLVDFLSINNFENSMSFETEVDIEGKSRKYINIYLSPVRCDEGHISGAVITLHDITKIKIYEEKVNRTNKLVAMGEMAASIAHEIRNPLGSIELFTNILENELKNSDEKCSIAKHITKGVKSINSIISNMLLFINPQQNADFRLIDIHDILNDSLFFSKHLIESQNDIKLNVTYENGPLIIEADPELLKQVFLNILLNAFQAMPGRGEINIETAKIKNSNNKNYVQVTISDTGSGISDDEINKIYDPFFSTKKGGTGLGLTIVHSIMIIHRSNIEIKSTKGKGTVCTLTIPEYFTEFGEK